MTVTSPFDDATSIAMLRAVATRWSAREAMVSVDARVSYAELLRRIDACARGFAALGLVKGDALAIWLPNRPLWWVAQQAAASLGIVVVALNPRYRAHELHYILQQSDTTALLLTDRLGSIDYLDILHEVLPDLRDGVPGEPASTRLPRLCHVIVDADDPYSGCHRLADVLEAGSGPGAPRAGLGGPGVGVEDLFTILYTSGTTAFPKGALITHANCVAHAWHCAEALRLTPEDRVLHTVPAAGTWGGVNIPLTTWSHGACLVLMESYDPLGALALIERERCTVWNAVDSMVKPMLNHPALDRYDRSSLRTGGFAATGGGGHGLFEAVVTRLGVPQAFQPYGMTEVNAMAMYHDLDAPIEERALPGVRPAPGLEARVVDAETGAVADVGVEGELQFRGRQVTPGYYKKPEETAKAFTADGWFRTGDLAVRDVQGRIVFRGRLRESLRISHHMVAPSEIEAFLMSHPDVEQAFVVGIPDPESNEAPVAYVIRRPGACIAEQELRAWCRGRLASFKIPRGIRFVADVPRTPGPHGDKVQRLKLREQALAEFGTPHSETPR